MAGLSEGSPAILCRYRIPSNLYEVLQAAGVSEAQVAREDITQKSTKTIPLRLERAVTQYGDFQFA